MRALVTGAAGFIGSHACDRLARAGHDVWGIDSFESYYGRDLKQRNVALARAGAQWRFEERTVGSLEPGELAGVDVVIHLAAQPGVRDSWAHFDRYTHLNLVETNHLASVVRDAGIARVVFASSSSVYGNASTYPTAEGDPLAPRSPYGVTKQAGESLWAAHAMSSGATVLALRLFTVYGPGQRPDMATQRLIRAALDGTAFPLFGDGRQRRDFTFVADVEDAIVSACTADTAPGFHSINVGGAGDTSMLDLIGIVERTVGAPVALDRFEAQRGDADRTGADISRASDLLGWIPAFGILDGVARQVEFVRNPGVEAWSSALVLHS